jgi:hypothetical protein
VPQLRPRFILVALRPAAYAHFAWPSAQKTPPTVGETLRDLMAAGGWPGADAWARAASGIGPTLVGGSRKHGGPDLGPTRARQAWLRLQVDGKGLADGPPGPAHPLHHLPRLTLPMAAAIQGFPPTGISGAARRRATARSATPSRRRWRGRSGPASGPPSRPQGGPPRSRSACCARSDRPAPWAG